MNTHSVQQLLEFAVDAAWQAGRVTLGYFQANPATEMKADRSPVTAADRGAEQKLRELIGRYRPGDGIIGEEFGQQVSSTGLTWILDPIDGTKSFVHGVPLYATLVAVVQGEYPLAGVLHFPALGETVYAGRGGGCYWNGRRAHVSAVNDLREAVALTSELDLFAPYGRAACWERVIEATYIQRTWGDAYGYALVATGRAEIMLDPVMEIWDRGPLQVVMEEAGGTFTDWSGKNGLQAREGMATNGVLLEQVIELLRE